MPSNSSTYKSLVLVSLMLFASWTPFLVLEEQPRVNRVTEWGSGGYNDTGWMRLDATGADPSAGQTAFADLYMSLAPGALVDNLTFEVRVNGSNDIWIQQPQLSFVDTQTSIMDWRAYGGLGQQNDMVGPDPHSSRLSPTVDTGASWLVPGNAEVTDLVIEALRPIDPLITFTPFQVEIRDSAVHPDDGRLYLAIEDALVQMDANNVPTMIELEEDVDALAMAVDISNDLLMVATQSDGFRAWSLSNSLEVTSPYSYSSAAANGEVVTAMMFDSSGNLWTATDSANLAMFTPSGAQQGVTSNPSAGDEVVDMVEVSGVMYLATQGSGVLRYDSQNGQWLSSWDTQNSLPSDDVNQLLVVNGVLMIAMDDAGIVRYNVQTTSWLATWTDANWLDSNEIHGLAIGGEWLHILAGDTLHHYNSTMGAFTSSKGIDTLGLPRSGMDLVAWPAGGFRSPTSDTVMVSDGSGQFARIVPANPPAHAGNTLLASGPNSVNMYDVLEISNTVWVAGDELVDRFDKTLNRWIDPIFTGSLNRALATDGSSVWVATSDDGVYEFSLNGSQTNHWTTMENLNSDATHSLAFDTTTSTVVVGHLQSGMTLIDSTSGNVSASWSTGRSDAFSNNVRAVTARAGIAYAASNAGVLRIDIANDTQLSTWSSTGLDDISYMPVETDGSSMYLGLHGWGVMVFDRVSGEMTTSWHQGRGNNGLSSNNVYSLHIDTNNDIWVGTSDGADRWDGNSWAHITPTGNGWQPTDFFDLTSDSSYLYAGTNAGACMYDLASLHRDDCWNYYSDPGLPSSWVYEVEMLTPGRLYAGTNYGAGVIDTVNDTVLDVWEAGEATWNAVTYEYDGVAYIGLNGVGIARFDRTTSEWLNTWESSSVASPIPSNDVTAMIEGAQPNQMWVGGDFGVRLIDLDNQTVLQSRALSQGQNDPAELALINNFLFASEARTGGSGGGGNSNDNIYIYNLSNNPITVSTIDAGTRIGQSGTVFGMNVGPDGLLWIGVAPSSWWGLNAGSIVRWNASNDSWAPDLEVTGSILRVNSVYAGECAPLNVSACHLFTSYGEKVHRHFDYYGNLLHEWDDSVITGPIRSIDLYQGIIHFATIDGIARYNHYNDTWLSTLTPGNGLPSNSEDFIYDIEIVGDDLWYATMDEDNWFNRNSRIFRLNGTTGQWTNWQAGSSNIPQGFGFAMEVCNDILHVAMSRHQGWGTQGGVARYDLTNTQWLSPWQIGGGQGNPGLADDDAVALACDEVSDIVYIGFQENDVGISRYNYGRSQFLSTISQNANGISPDQVFPDGMRWAGGVLMVSHTSADDGAGGISRIATQGSFLGSGNVLDTGFQASSMELRPNQNNVIEWLIGRPGGDSGYNRVDLLNSSGLHTGAIDVLAGLSSGRMLDLTFSGNEIWLTSADDSSEYSGSSILHGTMVNGSVNWLQAYSIGWDGINELHYLNNKVWFTTSGGGLWNVDPNSGQFSSTPMPLHGQMHGIWHNGFELVVGLMGTSYTAAGVQIYNLTTQSWTDGALLAGLPSNIVRDFVLHDNKVWVGTYGGIGVWNVTSQAWEDSITTLDGLPNPIVDHIWVEGTDLMLGSPNGLVQWSTTNESVTAVYNRNSGLFGDRVSGIAYAPSTTISSGNSSVSYGPTLFLSHNGEGATRPGATEFDLNTMQAGQQYQIDMLPSNDVRAICADWWGVHVATTGETLSHWNAASGSMEDGSPSWLFQAWPIQKLASDGYTLVAATPIGLEWVDPSGSQHAIMRQQIILNTSSVWVGNTGVWSTATNDGLYGFGPAPNYLPIDRESMRRAEPLSATFSGTPWTITNTTHPGERTILISPANSLVTSEFANDITPSGIPIHQLPLTLSSPVAGAAVWVSSLRMNYTGTWNLTDLNPNLENDFDLAVRRGALTPDGRELHMQLQSPLNGSLEVRITFDWTRSESAVEFLDLYDRPDDGGGVVVAEWTPSTDHGWAAYRIYLQEGNWTQPPTAAELGVRNYDARIPVWSITLAEITTVNGQLIQDGVDLYGVVLVEYDDGSLGEPSSIIGPAMATDEIPLPPEWGAAGPAEGGEDGDLYVEWAKCTALDIAATRVWTTTQEIQDAVGLTGSIDVNPLSNSTVLMLERGRPYWVALTCVDNAGQHDPANATIIGPVVPTGGVNDGTPPAPIADIAAWDTPNDEGGRITVSWTPNSEDDCAWHTVLVRPVAEDDPPTTAYDFSNASIIPDCSTNETIISDWGGMPLIDNNLYWVTVVAFDVWGNGDLGNVTSVMAMPERNERGSDPPPRVENLSAWDHPDDIGEAVDVAWDPSEVSDFSYYVVWASSQPVDDLSATWARCQNDVAACGAVRINMQYPMDEQNERMEITLTNAMYDGDTVENCQPDSIRPNVPLSVTVTIHDLRDAAFLTLLPSVVVTPIDNRDDTLAPERLNEPVVSDVPKDNGTALYIEFEPSSASDLSHYEVYADIVAYTSTSHREPVMIVDRDAAQPILLTSLQDNESIMSGIPIHVAVVPVDTSGNAHRDQLNVGTGKAIDNSGEDPGGHLPDVDFTANWNKEGTSIEVDWEMLTRTDIRSYQIYISEKRFENTDEADLAKQGIIGAFWSLELMNENETYDNSTYWYVAVVAYDGNVWKHLVDAKEIKPYTAPPAGGDGETDDGQTSSGILDLFDLNMILTILLTLAILVVVLLAVRARRSSKMQDEYYELATAAWGLPQDEGWGGTTQMDGDLAGTLMPAAAQIQADEPSSVTPQRPSELATTQTEPPPTQASAKLEELAKDLFDEPSKRSSTGDSDLDSLIDDLL